VLGTALWFVVALGLLAAVVLDGAAAFGRATVQAAADHALEGAMHDAVADYQNRLQTAIAQSVAPLAPAQPFAGSAPDLGNYASPIATLPDPLQGTVAAGAGTSGSGPASVAYTVTPTTLVPPACPQLAQRPPGGADAIGWLQCSGMVQESRMSLHVVVQVLAASGETLAQRDQFVSLRLFAEPPYSAVVGRADGSADAPAGPDALVDPPHEGDVGGATISGLAPVAQSSSAPAGGTSIHVQYECHDGAGHCANAAPPDPDAQLEPGASWTDGNRPQP
jgi:hypothetical protein